MRRPPPIARVPHYPVVAAVAVAATAVSLSYLSRNGSAAALTMDWRAFHGQPWRLLTSALPHGDPFHLLFNLYWLWALGTAIEERFGHLRALLLIAALAAVSAAAEFAVFGGGIGLSGVGYGLLGTALVLSRHEPKMADVVDRRTVQLFIGWGLLCVVTTIAGVFPVANVAHGSGFALGALVGLAVARPARPAWWLAVGAFVVATALGATGGRRAVNLSRARAAGDLAWTAHLLDEAGHLDTAATVFAEALRFHDDPARHANLGDVYRRLGRMADARASFAAGCQRDEPSACGNLAIQCEFGQGGPIDIAKAQELYRKACDLGSPESCTNLARF